MVSCIKMNGPGVATLVLRVKTKNIIGMLWQVEYNDILSEIPLAGDQLLPGYRFDISSIQAMASCNTSQANSIVCQSPRSDTPNAVTLFQRPWMRYKWAWSVVGVHVRANSLASLAGAGMSLKVETGNSDLKRRSVFWVYKYSTRPENVSGLLMAIGMTGRVTMKPG